MSGSGGGGLGSGGGERRDCSSLFIDTVLNSPVSKVIAQLKKGDTLKISLEAQKSGKSLVAKTADGKIAGSLTPAEMAQLIECMDEGFHYVAIVVGIDGGQCRVQIRPIRS